MTLAGSLNVTFADGFLSTTGQTFTIIRNDGPNVVSGTFAGPLGRVHSSPSGDGAVPDQLLSEAANHHDVTLTDNPYVVTTTADSGDGSLRRAILDADANPGARTITFDIPGSGVQVVTPLSALPAITNTVTIDGSTQPGYAGTPLIEIDGASAGSASVDGLDINGGSNTVISGVDINSFSGAGIGIDVFRARTPHCRESSSKIPTSGSMRRAMSPRPNTIGIDVGAVDGVQIANNVISGNASNGLSIGGQDVVVTGNFVDTNAARTAAAWARRQATGSVWVVRPTATSGAPIRETATTSPETWEQTTWARMVLRVAGFTSLNPTML